MGARLRVFLTRKQDKTLLNLRTVDVPQKVKDRAEVVRKHGTLKNSAHFNWTTNSREVLHKWQKLGLEGFGNYQVEGETKYKEEDIVLEECLKKNLVHTVFN